MPSPAWVIVETRPSLEETAERSLARVGYRAYLPRYRRILRPHGRGRRTTTALRPLFPRVVFVCDWRGWPGVPLAGTTRLMRLRRGEPATLADADITVLIERERSGEFDQAASADRMIRRDIVPGDAIELDAFGARIVGILDQLTENGRALVSLILFGGVVRAEVDAAGLNRVSRR